jgi:DNA-binding transcriptional regulator YiaG
MPTMEDVQKFDYGVWWSDEDNCFLARAMTLQAGTGYGASPEAALADAIAIAKLNAEVGHTPVARPMAFPGGATWTSVAIRELRRSLSLTQAELAELMNVSARAVTNWEQALNAPDGASRRLLDVIAGNPGSVSRWLIKREAEESRQTA